MSEIHLAALLCVYEMLVFAASPTAETSLVHHPIPAQVPNCHPTLTALLAANWMGHKKKQPALAMEFPA